MLESGPIHVFNETHFKDCRSVCFNQDGSYLASSSFDNSIKIMNMESFYKKNSEFEPIVLKH